MKNATVGQGVRAFCVPDSGIISLRKCLTSWPTGPSAQGDDMAPGEVLYPGESLTSQNGLYTLSYQTDGNLVLYRNYSDGRRWAPWASGTSGIASKVCIMQSDGNLVIYNTNYNPIWASGSYGHQGSRLLVQDDGNVVIYNTNGQAIWATNTESPIISDFSPASGQIDDTITLKGNNFVRIKEVIFGNGASASFKVNSSTMITATIPEDAKTGPMTVTNPFGSSTSNQPFTVIPTPIPIINSFTPVQGKVGTGVTITGSNLSRVKTVKFNGVEASFRIISDTQITTTVPARATDGPITVINRAGSTTSNNKFDVQETLLPANLAFLNTWITDSKGNLDEYPSGPFAVYFSFINGGQTETGKFTIRITLDNGAESKELSAPSYAPGATDFVYWPFPNGLPKGNHFFYAYLDINNQVKEISKADNVTYHGFQVP